MLTQTANYAVRAMGFIAREGKKSPVLSKTIAHEMDIPQNFLSKILHRLVQVGLIASARGTHGGFTLTRSAKEITLAEVVTPFVNLDDYRHCFLGRKCDGGCRLHKKWLPVQRGFLALLEETTIDQL
ncbi:MAG TPA: Rrf2 family transcriptional regulator [bacterium]|nr:Rrf2 family transcriptional regulator [bacterium]